MSLRVIALILPLALDTFAVAAALGAAGADAAARRRVTATMVAFEMAMPLLGLAVGAPLGRALGSAAELVAIVLLAGLGLHVLLVDDDGDQGARLNALRGWRAVAVGVSVSLDELAIGFTLGLLRAPVLLVILLIGAQAALASQIGLRLGGRLRERTREAAERLAGAVLLVLAVGLLVEHGL